MTYLLVATLEDQFQYIKQKNINTNTNTDTDTDTNTNTNTNTIKYFKIFYSIIDFNLQFNYLFVFSTCADTFQKLNMISKKKKFIFKFQIITNNPTRMRVRDEKEKLFDKVKRVHIYHFSRSVFGFCLLERR